MSDAHRTNQRSRLSARDRWLLPVLSLVTVLLLAVGTEGTVRCFYTETAPFVGLCMTDLDPVTQDRHGRPNYTCWDKKFESPRIEYRLNSCGDRTSEDCKSKPAGAYRIVLLGTSFVLGHLVSEPQTFASRLPDDIYKESGKRVEVYNKGMILEYPQVVARRVPDIIESKPDMILWVLTPYDIKEDVEVKAIKNPNQFKQDILARAIFRVKATLSADSGTEIFADMKRRAVGQFQETATATFLRRALYQNQQPYIDSTLAAGDTNNFLRSKLDPAWQNRLEHFRQDEAVVAAQAAANHIPLVVTLVPLGAQAAMISMGHWKEDYDPYSLDRELRNIVTASGATYIDILPDYRDVSHPERGYFTVDDHPRPAGHAVISTFLARELTRASLPDISPDPKH